MPQPPISANQPSSKNLHHLRKLQSPCKRQAISLSLPELGKCTRFPPSDVLDQRQLLKLRPLPFILAVLNRPTWHKKTKGHLKYPKVLTNGKQLMPSRQQLQQNNQLLQVLKFFGASEAHRRPSMPCPSKCSGSCTSHGNVQLDGAVNYLIPSGPKLHDNSC